MNITQAAYILRDMYNRAPYGEKTTYIRLFGIKYAEEIAHISRSELVDLAGIKSSYDTEIYKGIKLSKYVEIKPGVDL